MKKSSKTWSSTSEESGSLKPLGAVDGKNPIAVCKLDAPNCNHNH